MQIDRRRLVGAMAATLVPVRPLPAATTDPIVLEARPTTLGLVTAGTTNALGYARAGQAPRVPGPLLRVKQGEMLAVRLVNKLDQPTTLCWHGVRCPNGMDGVGGLTQLPVAPGASFDYRFAPPDAGLYWYHPHVFPQSAEQIARGLYGVLIVDEPEPPKVDDDHLVVVADWTLDAKGAVKGEALDPDRRASLVTVNGTASPSKINVRPGARLRLRLLNACASRVAVVGFDGLQSWVIAIDGQPSELFQPARGIIPIGPGARFEVLVDVPAAAKTARLVLQAEKGPEQALVIFQVAGEPLVPRAVPDKMPPNPRLPMRIPLERSIRPKLAIERAKDGKPAPGGTGPGWRWSLGGRSSDGFSDKPLFSVRRGGAVTLTLLNNTDLPQQMHVRGHAFRVLHDHDDGWDPYWRDSLIVLPGKTKLVAFVADNPGKWAIEALMVERQVTGLAGHFEVK